MSLATGTRLGRYEIKGLLGAGGMGEVYRAFDAELRRDVAIKVLPAGFSSDAERLHRFELEASAAGALNHPNILSIYDVGTHGGSPYVVSELLEGGTLRERMGGAALPTRRAVDYALEVARGMAAAHEKGIIHRDLKPENIFITADGRAKILDFGLAKLTEPDGDRALTDLPTRKVNTDPGAVMGTVGYMSPEQLRGRPVDARTDIFSFGAVLYEMLSGRRAFQRDSAADTISAVLREEPPELSETNRNINPALERIVRRCLEKNREARFHSASDLAFALEALSGTQSSGATATAVAAATATEPAPRRGRRGRLGWVVAAVLLASTLALAALHLRRAEPRAETMRFDVNVPEKAAFGGSLALSPDGRRLAFVVTGSGGMNSLWVRALDSTAARELPGTEGATFPFWSPDGRFIGFFAGSRLKKVGASGGPAQTLAETSFDPRGGAWGPDGTILFAPHYTSTLFKVSAAGGTAEPATELDQSREQFSHRWPRFLPDGRRFLYFSRSGKKEAEGVYVGSLDSGEGKLLLNTNLLADYVPAAAGGGAGHLLFMRDRSLVAQAFDAARLQLSGEPSVVAEGILIFPNEGGPTAYAAFTASANGHLAYLSGDVLQAQMTWFDRAGNSLGLIGEPAEFHEPSVSPDGRRIVVGRVDPQAQDLWMLDAARGTTMRFTFDPAADVCPLWSPDGARVVFSSNRGGGVFHLYQKISSGAGSDELFLRTEQNAFADDWLVTRDGRQFILYETEYPKTKFDLYVLPLDGERKPFPFLATEFNENHAQFSPDGRWVAYASDESGRPEVYVQSFPASGGKWQVSTGGGDQPQWRRDGRELFYVGPDKKLMAVPIQTGASFEAGTPAALFTTRVPLTGLTEDRNNYFPTPDGQRFLVISLLDDGNTQPITLVLNWEAGLKR